MAEQKSLADIMDGIGGINDPVQHFLALTYEFDENQLANLVSGRDMQGEARISHKQLLEISLIRPIVVYDAAKTKEARSLPQLLELHPWKSRAFGCHHSKAYCIVTSSQVHLVLGSFNLTQSGVFHNREVLDYFAWDIDDTQSNDRHILRQWTAFLRAQYLSRMRNSERSALRQLLETLEARNSVMPVVSREDSALVFSGYGEDGGAGLRALNALWTQLFPGESPTGLFVVSPFFDQNPDNSCITKDFLSFFPALREITICTAEETEPLLCKGHFGRPVPGANYSLFRIPRKTGEDERKIILAEAASQHVSISEEHTLERKLHAKILLLFNGKRGISYAGSANFSRNAWLGRNQELGLARREMDIPALRKSIMEGLYIEGKNRYAALPAVLPQSSDIVDGEAELTHSFFPDFIEYIILERCPETNRARFVLSQGASTTEKRTGSIGDYSVTWGTEPLVMWFDTHLASQWIENGQWQKRLVGGRNLAFRHCDLPGEVFWFPYQYADSLIDEKEYLLNITSSDWLLYYALGQRDFETSLQSGHSRDVESAAEYDVESNAPDRESNTVISMQRYLQRFFDTEDSFMKKIEIILNCYGENATNTERTANNIKNAILLPLDTFFSLLRREYAENTKADSAISQYAFRLGELLLFIRQLSKKSTLVQDILAPLCRDIATALHALSAKTREKDPILQSYLGFVLQKTA